MLALLGIARWKGVNLSALGIGVDFLQVVSLFSSFGFAWPPQLTALFAASSAASFNDQLVAPECSIGTWSFSRKYDLLGRGASACRRVGFTFMHTARHASCAVSHMSSGASGGWSPPPCYRGTCWRPGSRMGRSPRRVLRRGQPAGVCVVCI
jgi:hypothetical protein